MIYFRIRSVIKACRHILTVSIFFFLPSLFFFPVVLTAAVTQASLQSMLHKILTAGPSAFNITTILSQAAQLSNQGEWRPTLVTTLRLYFLAHTVQSQLCFRRFDMHQLALELPYVFASPNSSAIKPVTDVFNVRRLVAEVLRVAQDQHAADKRRPVKAPPQCAARRLAAKSKS